MEGGAEISSRLGDAAGPHTIPDGERDAAGWGRAQVERIHDERSDREVAGVSRQRHD